MIPKEAQSSKKPSAQGGSSSSSTSGGVKSKEGKRSSLAQQGGPAVSTATGQQQNPPKAISAPVSANRSAARSSPSVVTPPPQVTPHTPTAGLKQPSTATTISTGGMKNVVEPPVPPGPVRGGGITRSVHPQVQVRGHQKGVAKTTGHLAKVTKRTDAGSLDSEGPSSSSGDEESPSRRGTDTTQRGSISGHKLPSYYSDEGWGTRGREGGGPQRLLQQVQPQHHKEKANTIAVVAGEGSRVGHGFGMSSDTANVKQSTRAQKSVSAHTIKGGSRVGEGKVQPSKSVDSSKMSLRQPSTTSVMKPRDAVRVSSSSTSLVGKLSPPHAQMQAPPTPGLLQQQSPIQGLIDGPNSGPNGGKSGRESPPYLERQIPRDPSSQPQDAWPLFEDDPGLPAIQSATAVTISPMMLNAASMAQRQQQQQQQQQQAPPPTAPPTAKVLAGAPPTVQAAALPTTGGVVPPTTITATHDVRTAPVPPLSTPATNFAPDCLLPSVDSNSILTTTPPAPSMPQSHLQKYPHQLQKQEPTPPQSPHSSVVPDKLQGADNAPILSSIKLASQGAMPPPLPPQQHQPLPPHLQNVLSFRQPASPPATSIPSVFQSLLHQAGGHHHPQQFMTSAVMQQFYSRAGGIPVRPGGVEMLYNQAQAQGHSSVPPAELGTRKPGDNPVVTAAATPLITPLQPLFTSSKKSTTYAYGGERAATSPLLVTAYTQTTDPKVANREVQTERKKTRSQGLQVTVPTRKVKTQTDGEFVAADDLRPPLLQSDSNCRCKSLHVPLKEWIIFCTHCVPP